LPNPNNELIAEFGNIYGKWADYATTSGQTIRANSGSHQGIFLAEGTGQSGVVPVNQWGTGIIAVSLLPLAPPRRWLSTYDPQRALQNRPQAHHRYQSLVEGIS
jgi:hypothetical protein